MMPCRFYRSGSCRHGDKCRFSHEGEILSHQPNAFEPGGYRSHTISNPGIEEKLEFSSNGFSRCFIIPQSTTEDSRERVQCKFFIQGKCAKGALCEYAHSRDAEIQEKDSEDAGDHDDFKRVFHGALVEFGPGVQVHQISFPSDYSGIRISGIRLGTTALDIVSFIRTLGFEVPSQSVRLKQDPGGASLFSDIRFKDPVFAKTICSHVGPSGFYEHPLGRLGIVPTSIGLQSGHGDSRVECRKVQCSWFKPCRTAWLNFGAQSVATRVHKKFVSGQYKILESKARCSPPAQGGGFHNRLAWTVQITDLPAKVTEKDVRNGIGLDSDSPRHIEMSKPSYAESGEHASSVVLSLLGRAGRIEWSQANTELEGKSAKAVARFYEEADAMEAVRLCNDEILPFGTNLKLRAQLISTAKFKVSTAIFKVVKPQIQSKSQVWADEHLNYKFYPTSHLDGRFRSLKIEGQNKKAVAEAKEAMDKILRGSLVKEEGKPLWHSSLRRNGTLSQKLKDVERKHQNQIVVVRDRRRCNIIIYGSPEKCTSATRMIAHAIHACSDAESNTSIDLSPEQFQWACNGGFKCITKAVGEDAVRFDVVSVPKKIVLVNSSADLDRVRLMIKNRDETTIGELPTTDEDCAVCFSTPETPEDGVMTRCKHKYCADCLASLCLHDTRCYGDSGKCQVLLELDELRECLSSDVFEDILWAAFKSYIERNAQQYRYCPRPDCKGIYRRTDTAKSTPCGVCLTIICSTCQNSHPGQSCAEFKDETSGAATASRELKSLLGVQTCAKCKTEIIKDEGCDHVTCKCGAHLCWVCGALFETGEQCYKHLREKHGGIFRYR